MKEALFLIIFSDALATAPPLHARNIPLAHRSFADEGSTCEAYKGIMRNRWEDLSASLKGALEKFGFSYSAWNNFEMSCEQISRLQKLSPEQEESLKTYNISTQEWDCIATRLLRGCFSVIPDVAFPPPVSWNVPGIEKAQATGMKLALGVFPHLASALIASITGQLLFGRFGADVAFVALSSRIEAFTALRNGTVDLIMDFLETKLWQQKLELAGIQNYGSFSDMSMEQLYISIPKSSDYPYTKKLDEVAPGWEKFGLFYSSLEGILSLLPHKSCSMGPWTQLSEYGVWCANAETHEIPIIWAEGPISSKRSGKELLAFINWAKFRVGVDFVDTYTLSVRVNSAAKAGRPALFLLREPSNVADLIEDSTRRIHLPMEREHLCGEVGSAEKPGKWKCAFSPHRVLQLGGAKMVSIPVIGQFVSNINLHDDDFRKLYQNFREHFDPQRWNADESVQDAARMWVADHADEWRTWHAAEDLDTSILGCFFVLGSLGAGLLVYLVAEFRKPKAAQLPDKVDRSSKPKLALELLSGTMDTVGVLMRSIGMAAVLCSSENLSKFQGVVFKHIVIGQIVGQTITLLSSRYETPVLTPSMEILPILKVVLEGLESGMQGASNEAMMVTLFACSVTIGILSGFLCALVGFLEVGWVLRYMPYSVHAGVKAALGVVLLALGFEASCELNILEVEATQLGKLFDGSVLTLWIPALISAIGIYVFTKFVVDSPYTIVVFISVALILFHGIRSIMGSTMEEATESGWLYGSAPASVPYAMYILDYSQIHWASIIDSVPEIGTAVFLIAFINCGCQLAVTPSVLPPAVMGESDFNHEMITQGRSHILAGLLLGFPADIGNDDTCVHRMFGGKVRLGVCVHIVTLVLFVLISFLPTLLVYIPKFINGTIIFIGASEFLVAGLVDAKREFKRSEYYVVLAITGVAVFTGGEVHVAIAVGVIIGFADYVIHSANTKVLSFKEARSVTTWSAVDSFRLNCCGLRRNIVIAKLHNFLFFASASTVVDDLLSRAEELLNTESPHVKAFIVDWSSVQGVDTAAVVEFRRFTEAILDATCVLMFCGMQPRIASEFQRLGVVQDAGESAASSKEKPKKEHSAEVELTSSEQQSLHASPQREPDELQLSPAVSDPPIFSLHRSASSYSTRRRLKSISGDTFPGVALSIYGPTKYTCRADAVACESRRADAAACEATEDSAGCQVPLLTNMEESLFIVERSLLQYDSAISLRAHISSLAKQSGAISASARFRALAKALGKRSAIAAIIRKAIIMGNAKMHSYFNEDVVDVLQDREAHASVLVVGAVVVSVHSEKKEVALRHVDSHYLFLDERCSMELSYRAAPFCALLQIAMEGLEERDRNVLQCVATHQLVQVKNVLAHDNCF